jgi:rapamycin-insensitive companion of mTOR
MTIVQDVTEMAIVRKTTLLIGEILKLTSRLLPSNYSSKKQLLPALFNSAARLDEEDRFAASAAVYQIDSLNRTLHRTMTAANPSQRNAVDEQKGRGQAEQVRMNMNMNIDDTHFRALILETNVGVFSSYQLRTLRNSQDPQHQKSSQVELECFNRTYPRPSPQSQTPRRSH